MINILYTVQGLNLNVKYVCKTLNIFLHAQIVYVGKSDTAVNTVLHLQVTSLYL